jgi:hypothetical protein
MNTTIKTFLLGCAVALLATGCATTHESLRSSTLRLDDRASHFSAQVHSQGDEGRGARVSQDAQALAASTHALSRAVDVDSGRGHTDDAFERVSQDYQRLHDHLADAGYAEQNRRVLEDFDRVTEAYRNVENAMGYRHSYVEHERSDSYAGR